ncbi:hypothetical protein [Undibacterium sp. SXout20W]
MQSYSVAPQAFPTPFKPSVLAYIPVPVKLPASLNETATKDDHQVTE